MHTTDEILVRRCLGGDKSAFGQLIQKYQRIVYGLAYHFSGKGTDAQDLAQEAFLQAYLKLDQLHEPAKSMHWLRRITANVCKMWFRRGKPETTSWEHLRLRPPTEELVEAGLEEWELRYSVHEAIQELSEKNRLAVTLYYVDASGVPSVPYRSCYGKPAACRRAAGSPAAWSMPLS